MQRSDLAVGITGLLGDESALGLLRARSLDR